MKFSFSVCRVCFVPECVGTLSSLFEGKAENLEKFLKVSGIDISGEREQHEALICKECLKELNRAFEFRGKVIRSEQLYFVKCREEFEAEHRKLKENKEAVAKDKTDPKAKKQEFEINLKEIDISDVSFDEEMEGDESIDDEQPQMFELQKENKKSFICPTCQKSFLSKSHLVRHIKSVHEKITRFTCATCQKGFYDKRQLQRHMTTHTFPNDDTSNSARPFKCDEKNCGRFYKNKRDLKRHQKLHSNVKCHCGASFILKSYLNIHQERVHQEGSSKEVVQGTAEV